MTALTVTLGGLVAHLLPERAAFLPESSTLLVADLHWGKTAALRAAFVPVPSGSTAHDLARLSELLHATRARTLVVLGDLLHAREGRHPATMRTIAEWREQHSAIDMVLVRGNHDRRAGDPPSEFRMRCEPHWRSGDVIGVHDPSEVHDRYVVAGHLHPHLTLRGRGRQSLRLPCFVVGPTRAVLPAFSSLTGSGMYEREAADRHYVIAGGEVVVHQPLKHTALPR